MKILHFFRCISVTCIFILLIGLPAGAFAKRPSPPPPPPEPEPIPIGTTELVSKASDGTQANNQSYSPSITSDGRFVLFTSVASNLVPNDTNGKYDVFVHDQTTGITERVSVASDGTEANNSSGDGD
ncbi:MAG TPA: hypothetical protein VIQ03_06870, partial [Gammaproteobacteria bacterium]